jgi:hypothetical protein
MLKQKPGGGSPKENEQKTTTTLRDAAAATNVVARRETEFHCSSSPLVELAVGRCAAVYVLFAKARFAGSAKTVSKDFPCLVAISPSNRTASAAESSLVALLPTSVDVGVSVAMLFAVSDIDSVCFASVTSRHCLRYSRLSLCFLSRDGVGALLIIVLPQLHHIIEHQRRVSALSNHDTRFRIAASYHLATIRIERIADDPLRRILCMVVLEAETPKAFGDSFEARSLRLMGNGC